MVRNLDLITIPKETFVLTGGVVSSAVGAMAQCSQLVLDMTHVEGQRQGENRDLLLMSLVWYLKFTPRNVL